MSKKKNVSRQQVEVQTEAVESVVEPIVEPKVEPAVVGEVVEPKAELPEDEDKRTLEEKVADPAWMIKQSEGFLIGYYGNKSKAIRGLNLMGHKCGPISRALNIRFQHARNVLEKPLKRLIKEERAAQQQPTAE